MSKTEADESTLKNMPFKIGPKKPRKIFKFRFLTETNLHNVRREQIFFYIVSLHKRIRLLVKKCKRYREKILKLVSMTIINLLRILYNKNSVDYWKKCTLLGTINA